MDDKKVDPDKRMEAVWCVDSESGEQVLMDRETNRRVAHKDADGRTVWEI